MHMEAICQRLLVLCAELNLGFPHPSCGVSVNPVTALYLAMLTHVGFTKQNYTCVMMYIHKASNPIMASLSQNIGCR